MPLPSINVAFKETGATAIERGERGVVAVILDDTSETGLNEIITINDIPDGLTESNQEYIEFALEGYVNPPLKVLAYVGDISGGSVTLDDILSDLEMIKFDYICFPEADDDTATDSQDIASQVTSWRDSEDKKVKAVLYDTAEDHEGIINVTTETFTVDGTDYTGKEYTSRIAGLLAGTPLTISATFAPLSEVDEVSPTLSNSELDTAIDDGEFVCFHDGEKVKVARAVNSLVTTYDDKGEQWKKIKIVDILDLWFTDVKTTVEDNYIGKYANSYDNKLLLVSAIDAYNRTLELDELLASGVNSVGIDVEAQKDYLENQGEDTNPMSEQEIKEANTDDQVFLAVDLSPLDAMEDISLKVFI